MTVANAGGVIVSYFEWVQNNQGYYWEENKVLHMLRERLTAAFHNVYRHYRGHPVDMRLASYMVGLKPLTEAVKYRGWL